MLTAIIFFVLGYVSHDLIKDEVTSIVTKIRTKIGK